MKRRGITQLRERGKKTLKRRALQQHQLVQAVRISAAHIRVASLFAATRVRPAAQFATVEQALLANEGRRIAWRTPLGRTGCGGSFTGSMRPARASPTASLTTATPPRAGGPPRPAGTGPAASGMACAGSPPTVRARPATGAGRSSGPSGCALAPIPIPSSGASSSTTVPSSARCSWLIP